MQAYDLLQERIDELETIVRDYETSIIELNEKLRFSEQDKENYYDVLKDFFYTLKRTI